MQERERNLPLRSRMMSMPLYPAGGRASVAADERAGGRGRWPHAAGEAALRPRRGEAPGAGPLGLELGWGWRCPVSSPRPRWCELPGGGAAACPTRGAAALAARGRRRGRAASRGRAPGRK